MVLGATMLQSAQRMFSLDDQLAAQNQDAGYYDDNERAGRRCPGHCTVTNCSRLQVFLFAYKTAHTDKIRLCSKAEDGHVTRS